MDNKDYNEDDDLLDGFTEEELKEMESLPYMFPISKGPFIITAILVAIALAVKYFLLSA